LSRLFSLLFLLACGGSEPTITTKPMAPAPKPVAPPAPTVSVTAVPDIAWRMPEQGVASPAARPAEPGLVGARASLEELVVQHARDPQNPWAISHALLALGADIQLTNDADAVDWLFETYAKNATVGNEPGIRFPRKDGAIRIEPHTDLILKALTEAAVSPDREVSVEGKTRSVADLYRHSLGRVWVDGDQVSVGAWNDTPWALQALATWAPSDLSWTSEGRAMTLDLFTAAVVAKLSSETAFMRTAMASGQTVKKRGQGIFAYTCGGAHLLQGSAYAVWRGYGDASSRQSIVDEVAVLYWRLTIELAAVDQALQQHPEYAVVLLEQRMKFLGHFLESTHKLAAMGFYEPTDEQRLVLETARNELVKTVGVLESMGVFERLNEMRVSNEQTYLDFVGDAAHALRGIDLSTGAATVR
jgi:hypothetical protein